VRPAAVAAPSRRTPAAAEHLRRGYGEGRSRRRVSRGGDHEAAPAEEMLTAAARIARGVDVPVTVDAEAGYGMEPAALVAALQG
jgi:Phosphoenolpyruvate phosphomutase